MVLTSRTDKQRGFAIRKAWIPNQAGWIGRDLALSIQMAEEGPDGRQLSRYRGLGVSFPVEMAQKVPNGDVVDVEETGLLPTFLVCQMVVELEQIPPVALEGPGRIVFLELQIVEEELDGVEHCPPTITPC